MIETTTKKNENSLKLTACPPKKKKQLEDGPFLGGSMASFHLSY